ncbi:MAG: hypothetical protein IH849_15980 [Acidobacteria bacterium]|nr:hypothetical protein [Acidobacteriota bacterium]
MAMKLVIGLLLAPAIFLGLLLSADYAIVDVREGGPDGMHIIVPVPLSLVRLALNFAPAEAKYVQVPEIAEYAEYMPYAEHIIEVLREASDGVLVSVQERDQTVLVEKVGDTVEIHVNDGDEVVDVTVPLDAVLDILRAYDGEGFDTRDLIRAVGRAHGNIVHVRNGDQEVKVYVW